MSASPKPNEVAFWEVADEFLARGVVDEGTMFGFRCIRAQGEFVAMPGNTFGGMVVKLPADRVTQLVDSGDGAPVAPAGRTFKEWVAVEDQRQWSGLIEESIAFVAA